MVMDRDEDGDRGTIMDENRNMVMGTDGTVTLTLTLALTVPVSVAMSVTVTASLPHRVGGWRCRQAMARTWSRRSSAMAACRASMAPAPASSLSWTSASRAEP